MQRHSSAKVRSGFLRIEMAWQLRYHDSCKWDCFFYLSSNIQILGIKREYVVGLVWSLNKMENVQTYNFTRKSNPFHGFLNGLTQRVYSVLHTPVV